MTSRLLSLFCACFVAPAPLLAQELPTFFHRLETGDVGPLGGPVLVPLAPTVNREQIVYQTAFDAPSMRYFTAQDQRLLFVQGDPLPGSNRVVLEPPQFMCVTPGGHLWALVGLTDPTVPSGVLGLTHGGRTIAVPGQICTAPGVPPGSRYSTIATISGAFDEVCYVVSGLDLVGPTEVILELRTDSNGTLLSERVVAMPGMSIPGLGGTINRALGGSIHENGASCLTVVANGSGGSAGGRVVVVNQSFTIRPGDPSPYPGRTWGALFGGTVSRHGHWLVSGELDDGKKVLVKNGQAFFHEDELPPELNTAGVGVAALEALSISSRDRALWRVRMDQSTSPVTVGYFVERKPFLISQQTIVDGFPTGGQIELCGADEDGVNVGVGLGYSGPIGNVRLGVAFPLDQSDVACTNGPASGGQEPTVSVHGSPWVADGTDFEIMTQRIPARTFALTLASDRPGSVSNPAGSIGDLCLSGQLFRSAPLRASQLGTTRVWLSQLFGSGVPTPSTGDTWYFQTWYRDVDSVSGGAVSRWTEAVSLEFE